MRENAAKYIRAQEWEQNWAGRALAKIGKPVVRPLLLSLSRYAERDWIAETLFRVGSDAISILTDALQHSNEKVRIAAAEALNKIQGGEE